MKGICLIIVPHQDDETNLVGNIVDRITEEYETFVLYGSIDPDIEKGVIRKREAIEACSVWKISKDHLIFLNYPDTPNKAGQHYYSEGDYRIVGDLKKWILKLKPSIIFATDFDYHSDHRMLSIAFDTAIGQVLKEHTNYNPVILKGFCYETAYYSVEDYKASKPQNSISNINPLSNPSYEWSKRITIRSIESPGVIWHRKAYKALKAHQSQYALLHARSIVNQDNVYWIRRSDNLLNKAVLSSCLPDNKNTDGIEKIRDFKILDTDDLITKDPRKIDYSKACCKFESGGIIKAQWDSSITFDRLVFHGSVNNSERQRVNIEVAADGHVIGEIDLIEPYGRETVILLPETTAQEIVITMNNEVELSEIEVFSEDLKLPDFINSCNNEKDDGHFLIGGIRGGLVDLVDTLGYKLIIAVTKIRRKHSKIKDKGIYKNNR